MASMMDTLKKGLKDFKAGVGEMVKPKPVEPAVVKPAPVAPAPNTNIDRIKERTEALKELSK